MLRVLIDPTGVVKDVQVISGHPMLAPSATETMMHWTFKPYYYDGEPVEVEANITVNFKLVE